MIVTMLIAGAMAAQSGAVTENVPAGMDRIDVAYEELAERRPNAAIKRIRANDAIEADDPAALINLGAAYAMLGKRKEAEECYRAAIASEARYDLQLADGTWMDSRRLARVAARKLARNETLAAR